MGYYLKTKFVLNIYLKINEFKITVIKILLRSTYDEIHKFTGVVVHKLTYYRMPSLSSMAKYFCVQCDNILPIHELFRLYLTFISYSSACLFRQYIFQVLCLFCSLYPSLILSMFNLQYFLMKGSKVYFRLILFIRLSKTSESWENLHTSIIRFLTVPFKIYLHPSVVLQPLGCGLSMSHLFQVNTSL